MAGQISVTPLLLSNIAWTEYLKDILSLTGHSPTRGIDACNLKLSSYAQFIASLGEFRQGKETNSLSVIRSAGDLLSHLHFGFLIHGDSSLIFRIMELTDLKITSTRTRGKGRVAVVTGSLNQWKQAIIFCLDSIYSPPYNLRWVFNTCLHFFNQLGLSEIFHNYRRKGLEDHTFLLEYRG